MSVALKSQLTNQLNGKRIVRTIICCIFAPSLQHYSNNYHNPNTSPQRSSASFCVYVLSLHSVSCDPVQTDEARRWVVHQRVQQTPRTALSAEVPGVSDREAGQVGDLNLNPRDRRADLNTWGFS